MIQYWPFSVVATSPLLNEAYKWELSKVHKTERLSDGAMTACFQCALSTPPIKSSLAITYLENGTSRFVYLRRPSENEWLRLERKVFVQESYEFGLVVDALH